MVRPFSQKDRFDAAFEKFVVKFRSSSRRGDCGGDRQHGQNRHAYESASRHSTLHQRRRISNSDRTSNANLDKLELVPGKKPRNETGDFRSGSIATELSRQQVSPCALRPEGGSFQSTSARRLDARLDFEPFK